VERRRPRCSAETLDVVCTNIGSIADAYAHGLPIALFAPSTLAIAGQSNTTLAVLRDSPIRTAHDLIGKTIALSTLRDLQHAALLEWLAKNGGDIKATNYVEVSPANMLEALKLRRVDAVVMSELYSAVGRNDTHVLGRPYEALGRTIMVAGWAARRDWLAANPLAARKFLGAMVATARWAASHQPEILPVMHDITGTDLDTLAPDGPALSRRHDRRERNSADDQLVGQVRLPPARLPSRGRWER